jgi:hypothetical protein
MGAVLHFLGEDIGGVDFPCNMYDIQSLVLHPFSDGIFTELDMTSHLWGRVVGSFDTCIIVIVQKQGRRETLNFVAALRDAARKISKIDDLFWGRISSTNFSLTRAERHTLLMLAKPTRRTAILENDATIHTPKLEEGKKSNLRNCAFDLITPTSITVSGDGLSCRWFWRDGVSVGFDISRWRIMNVGMHRGHIFRDEADTIVEGGMDVV